MDMETIEAILEAAGSRRASVEAVMKARGMVTAPKPVEPAPEPEPEPEE